MPRSLARSPSFSYETEKLALEVGAVGFGFGEAFEDGERFLEIGLGVFVLAEPAGEIAKPIVGNAEVALKVGAVGFGLGETFRDGERFSEMSLGCFALA